MFVMRWAVCYAMSSPCYAVCTVLCSVLFSVIQCAVCYTVRRVCHAMCSVLCSVLFPVCTVQHDVCGVRAPSVWVSLLKSSFVCCPARCRGSRQVSRRVCRQVSIFCNLHCSAPHCFCCCAVVQLFTRVTQSYTMRTCTDSILWEFWAKDKCVTFIMNKRFILKKQFLVHKKILKFFLKLWSVHQYGCLALPLNLILTALNA